MSLRHTFRLANAIRTGCLHDARTALRRGADPNGVDADGRSMLMLAENSNATFDMIRLLLQHDANPYERVGNRDDSLIHLAARHDNHGFAFALIQHRVDPNRCNGLEETPLHIAAERGNRFLCDLLVANGIRSGDCDANGFTAADRAFMNGHHSLANRLGGVSENALISASTDHAPAMLLEQVAEVRRGGVQVKRHR